MSKHEEFSKTYAERRKEYFERRESARRFAGVLARQLAGHLSCPEDHIRFFPPDRQTDPAERFTPETAVAHAFGRGDAWQFALGVVLPEGPDSPNAEIVKLEFSIAGAAGNAYTVSLRDTYNAFVLPTDGEIGRQHKALFENIDTRLEKTYEEFVFFDETPVTQRKLSAERAR